MSHKMLRPFIVKVSVLGYFTLIQTLITSIQEYIYIYIYIYVMDVVGDMKKSYNLGYMRFQEVLELYIIIPMVLIVYNIYFKEK